MSPQRLPPGDEYVHVRVCGEHRYLLQLYATFIVSPKLIMIFLQLVSKSKIPCRKLKGSFEGHRQLYLYMGYT